LAKAQENKIIYYCLSGPKKSRFFNSKNSLILYIDNISKPFYLSKEVLYNDLIMYIYIYIYFQLVISSYNFQYFIDPIKKYYLSITIYLQLYDFNTIYTYYLSSISKLLITVIQLLLSLFNWFIKELNPLAEVVYLS